VSHPDKLTFPGEREAAFQSLARYQAYQIDDRHPRLLAKARNPRAAVAFNTGLAPGDSNYDFARYDESLRSLIAINQTAFDRAIHDGERELRGWTLIPPLGVFVIAGLILGAVRPRLAEYG
jgi:hypothetical protein